MTKTPAVLDTMVFLRMVTNKRPYVDVLERIKEICNKILISTSIVKEWRTKAYVQGMSSLIILRILRELDQIKKLKRCKKTSIDKAARLIKKEKCRKPTDKSDLKFVEVALAGGATLITDDQVLLDLNPYKCANARLDILRPEEYLENS